VPFFVFDAGYDPVQLQQGLKGHDAQLLVRLRLGRRFYADPEGLRAPTYRPRRHGKKFDCKDPKSCPEPTYEHVSENEHYGTARARLGGAAS
jgi:DDE superfamily endonuclease